MSQVPNELLRQKILQTARRAFLEVGFRDASIRTIAREVGTTKSNIYTYFSSKDELFSKVVEPTLDTVHAVLDLVADDKAMQDYLKQERSQDEPALLAGFINRNRENLQLLLLQSAGTSLADVKDRFINAHNRVMEHSLSRHAVAMSLPCATVSSFFVHFLSSTIVKFVEEVIRFDLPHDQILQHAQELNTYHAAGIAAVMSRG